jgi:hypothetical protein
VIIVTRIQGHYPSIDRVESAPSATAALMRAASTLAVQVHMEHGLSLDDCESMVTTVTEFTPDVQAAAA